MSNSEDVKRVSTWRIILAFLFDFIMAFVVIGYVIAKFFGKTTENGFELNGLPALLLFALVALYFWAFSKYFGGTIWQRIFKAVR